MTSFEELGLGEKTLGAVKRMGFSEPTPVQVQAIPLVLKGRDVLAAAQTGTGKTAAFILPAMDSLGHSKRGGGPLMLVVTPTRELAQQIAEVARTVAIATHHRVVTVVGGLSYKPQTEKLKAGCDILIATPGRLIDLMEQKAVNLGSVEILVLDEADRMLDMGFLPAVKRIVAATPKSRQTLLFSATIDKSILSVAGGYMRDPATVEVARKGDVASTVDHYIIRVPQAVKPALLKAVLEEKGFFRVIVFARTRSRADATGRRLRRAGYKAEAIHSDRSQNQRKRSLDRFAKGDINIIAATDVLARGIDVDEVDYVVNFDVPDQPEDYIHRIGRTGRAGAKGMAITFVTPESEEALKAIERLIKTEIPEMTLESFDREAAIATAAENSMASRANRDPEVRRVKREMASRSEQKQRVQSRKAQPGKKGKDAPKKPAKSASSNRGTKSSLKPKKSSSGPKRDFRPGRSHRAAVRRSRSK